MNLAAQDLVRYRALGFEDLEKLGKLDAMAETWIEQARLVSFVFPTRFSPFLVDNLIDWQAGESDPLFRSFVPQPSMLKTEHLCEMQAAYEAGDASRLYKTASKIRQELNPNVSNQESNIPVLKSGARVPGLQHKYDETVLLFPKHGQTCHAYCQFCFRFPQFTGPHDGTHYFSTNRFDLVSQYLSENPEVTDLLVTGGDPLIMNARELRRALSGSIDRCQNIKTVRLGTRFLTFWPFRLTRDPDSSSLLSYFEEIVDRGLHLSIMAHIAHPNELSHPATVEAIGILRSLGATIRSQSPILRGVNDAADVWADLWKRQVELGIIPYYMFVARDTGPHDFYSVPLREAYEVYRKAIGRVSGLARTVRGPTMSTEAGKVQTLGPFDLSDPDLFLFKFLQARNSDWVERPFLGKINDETNWIDGVRSPDGQCLSFAELFD